MTQNLTISQLHDDYRKLQKLHGDPSYDPIFGAGKIDSPDLMLIFMNPTARNIASLKKWRGIKAPWIGTKQIWKMLADLGLFDKTLSEEIGTMRPEQWDEAFSTDVYLEIAGRNLYITNLAKCTQSDARPLPNSVFRAYLALFNKEIQEVQPKILVTFGNQVSSIFLDKTISVSRVRKQKFRKRVGSSIYSTYSLFYPVGQGRRNMPKAKEDIRYILSTL